MISSATRINLWRGTKPCIPIANSSLRNSRPLRAQCSHREMRRFSSPAAQPRTSRWIPALPAVHRAASALRSLARVAAPAVAPPLRAPFQMALFSSPLRQFPRPVRVSIDLSGPSPHQYGENGRRERGRAKRAYLRHRFDRIPARGQTE